MLDLRAALRHITVLGLVCTSAVGLVACGGSGSSPAATGATVTVTGGKVAISADKLKYDVGTIKAKAGEAFTITFTNMESPPHDVGVYRSNGGGNIVRGNIISGPNKTDAIAVPALAPGTYLFKCDVHPEMNGTVVVS